MEKKNKSKKDKESNNFGEDRKSKEGKEIEKAALKCNDKKCPIHGHSSIHGRFFQGTVKKIVGQRAVVEFERLVYIKKYERFAKTFTKLHAYLPKCLINEIKAGDIIKIGECRPLSKIIHFTVIKKIK